MGIGVDKNVYDWIAANAPSYLDEEFYEGEDGGYYWFYELPDSLQEIGGAIYTVSNRPSQEGVFIGNTI